jgi:hypothetical protein
VDEADLRRKLTALAGTEAPQARFDIEFTMARGRRNRRLRRAAFVSSAVAAAVALVIVLVVVPRSAALPDIPAVPGGACASVPSSAPTASPSRTPDPVGTGAALAVPPEPFSPLTPCVSFGWLPPGSAVATLANGNYAEAYRQYTVLYAGSAERSLQLYVNAADACTRTVRLVNCGWLGPLGYVPLTYPAPAIGGRPAWWAPDCGLLWEYAPSSWALVRDVCAGSSSPKPPASMRPLLTRMAASAKFTDGSPMVFPFWFSGAPADWQAYGTQFVESRGVRDAVNLAAGPAADPGAAVDITVIPASDSTAVRNNIDVACGGGGAWGAGRPVSVDGAPATVWTLNESGNQSQKLCAGDVRGYAIWLSLNGRRPAGFGSVTELARALHLLGTDPAGWTANPLR